MLDFDSEDIDGMDADEGGEQEAAPKGHGKATSSYDIYMVDTPKAGNAMKKRRMTPPRRNPSANVIGAALSPAEEKVVIPAQEIITLRIVPKMATVSSSTIWHRRMERPALQRERQMERRRIITCPPLKTRQASTMTNSSCQRIPSNKSASSAGL